MSGSGVTADGEGLLDLVGPEAMAVLAAETAGAMLIGGDGRQVLWANDQAASALGVANASALMAQPLPDNAPGTDRFRALMTAPASATPSLERLRFFIGFRGVMRIAFCRRITLRHGTPAIVVAFTQNEPGQIQADGLPAVLTIEVARAAPEPFRTPSGNPLAEIAAAIEEQLAQPIVEASTSTSPAWLQVPKVERRALRFLFSLDAQGFVRSVSPPLAATVGAGPAAIEGRLLPDVVRAYDPDAADEIEVAITDGETFTGIRVHWPVEGADITVPVDLSALPLIEQTIGLKGFSGFGHCRTDMVEANSSALPQIAEARSELADERIEAAPSATEPESVGSRDEGEIVDADDERRAAGRVPAPEDGANVVSLRTGQPTSPLPGFQRHGLSMSERNAFREIAKALGARFDEDETLPGLGKPEPASETPGRNIDEVFDQLAAAESETHPATQPAFAPVRAGNTDLLDRLPIGLLVLRGDDPLYANQTLLDLTGYPDFAHFKAEDGARAIFRKSTRPSASSGVIETVVLASRDGEMMPVDCHLQMVEWESAPATLISLRRAVELEQGKALRSVALDLKRSRADVAELRAILDTATDGVVLLDETGSVLGLNGAAQALFGVNENEMVGESFTLLLHRDSHADALHYLEGMRMAGVRSILNDGREVSGREKKGGRIPLFMTIGRISEDEPKRFCAVLRDMTAWKRAEAGLNEARQAAEIANAKKSDFLAKISHEIRTPMNAIMGFADLMQEERLGPLGNEKYKEYLGDIRTSGQHVVSLVNDLLDLAKIEAGRMELNFAATDLNAIVASTVAIIQPQANQNRVLVRTQLAQKLPPVVADERSIRQIVLNMLSNATRFTEAGGQVIVSTSLLPSGEVTIRIRDTGIGMTASEIEQALEPFRQVGRDRSRGGTGLGLPLTKALVEANRASFGISSKPSEGTLVEITFPPTRVLAE
ncbi:MAG: PAS domain-containing protein [Rhizobiales bacterium]|nr:PAS domain-containing protein [Hyphomicrobiales bacterium]